MTYQELKAMLIAQSTSKARPRHNEEDMQMQCVQWFDSNYPQYAPLLHHSPNGGKRNAREAARFRMMGTRAGFPDLVLLVPNDTYPYLCIELKVGRNKQSEHQLSYQNKIELIGGKYAVVRSLDEFMRTVIEYLPA